MKLTKQIKYCNDNILPMFVPEDGKCWFCGKQIEDSDSELLTGCKHCHRSYCD